MITKENLLTKITDWYFLLSTPAIVSIFAGHDPTLALIGAIGQFVAIVSQAVLKVRKGQKLKLKPIWYWLVSVFVLGGLMGLLFTKTIHEKTGLSLLTSGLIAGSLAQYAFDFILAFKDAIINNINKGERDEV